jgi:ribonucleoside-diphosphate reductase beta chain
VLAGYDHLLRAADRLRWDERTLDLGADRPAFVALPAARRDALRRLVAGFCVGEVAVAEHLVPFQAAAEDADLQACLRVQADDERRHARFFARVAREVVGIDPVTDAPRLAGDALNALFGRLLPAAADTVRADPATLPQAVALYHLVLEGVVFAAGQDLLVWLLTDTATLPVTLDGVRRVQNDERWHIGLGVQALSAFAVEPPELDEAVRLALDAWGEAGDRDEALARHRRRVALLTARASAPRSPS